ncbi:FUSC family protein [Pseudalkalibacillus berkeleyi]|uniref:Aromatic acid exporter family protein n=1 Tax=Pseudalkalibacillus berkeleyi TaxID=1069813 RepID=A0ABS9H637_9BACL|nr:aromatic acid exporter family protein [Pseudalkalibacillus berkeleyi]MCF6139327.1 aromatic acid exporter family protein [Pseudalkalibacillus berkeleyi]
MRKDFAFKMKFGARIIKTGVAISLALYITMWLNLDSASFAAIAALFAIQPTIYRSYQTIIEQIQSNLIGATLAIIAVQTLGNAPIVIGLVSVMIIAINIKLKIETTIPLAIVTVIVLMVNPGDNYVTFAITRFSVIMIGVFCAFLVNLAFLPPKYETRLYHKNVKNMEQIAQWIRLATRNDAERKILKEDLMKINESMIKADNYYLMFKEERSYFKGSEYTKHRKLVLFRNMLSTTSKALAILKSLDQHDHKIYQMPETIQVLIQDQLDHLTNYHQRILMKYIGKVRYQSPDEVVNQLGEDEKELTEYFMELYDHKQVERDQWMNVFPLIGLIIDYNHHLIHLDKLVESFHTYHTADNEVSIRDAFPQDE